MTQVHKWETTWNYLQGSHLNYNNLVVLCFNCNLKIAGEPCLYPLCAYPGNGVSVAALCRRNLIGLSTIRCSIFLPALACFWWRVRALYPTRPWLISGEVEIGQKVRIVHDLEGRSIDFSRLQRELSYREIDARKVTENKEDRLLKMLCT